MGNGEQNTQAPEVTEPRSPLPGISWLNHRLPADDAPSFANSGLIGIYVSDLKLAIIYLVLSIRGTEYRIPRLTKTFSRTIGEDTNQMQRLHKNMVADFSKKHNNWRKVLNTALRWTNNHSYSEVFSAELKRATSKDKA